MRAAVGAIFFAVAANAQSPATTQGYATASSACSQALGVRLQSNQACTQQLGTISQAQTSGDVTTVSTFCSSACLPILNAGLQAQANCIDAYTPTLTANLIKDGVPNATAVAATMTLGNRILPEAFNFMCVRNERGDYCMPLYSRMGTDLAASGNSSIATVCGLYYNTGCCLSALIEFVAKITGENLFSDSLTSLCPSLAAFTPPKCLAYGQSALALTVTLPLTGLSCSAYDQQSDSFKVDFETALKHDLSAKGIPATYTTVKSVTTIDGACTVILVVRADNDADTKGLVTAAQAASSVTLTETNQVLATVPAVTASGSVTAGSAQVAQGTVTAQSVGGASANSGSSVVPSFFLAASVLGLWLA